MSATPKTAQIACPRCHAAMAQETFSDRMGRAVVIDMCHACQCFWFDGGENYALTPGSTLVLFRQIGEMAGKAHPAPISEKRCPRCRAQLALTRDMQRTTRFEYFACPKGHGRLISFFDFLREKDFIKPLTPQQIAELRTQVQFVNCSNCGAPVNLTVGSACTHCGTPLSMLDIKHTEKLVEQLQKAEAQPRTEQPISPLVALELERIKRSVRRQGLESFHEGPEWQDDLSVGNLVSAGLRAVARWLKSES